MTLPAELEKAIIRFFTYHPAERVNKHVRILLMEALNNGSLTDQANFRDILFDLEGIFELMDIAGQGCIPTETSIQNEGRSVSCL